MKIRVSVLPLLPVFFIAGIFDFCDPPTAPEQLCDDGTVNVQGIGCPAAEPPPMDDPPPDPEPIDFAIIHAGNCRNLETGAFTIVCEDGSVTVPSGGLVSVCWTLRRANGVFVEDGCSPLEGNPRFQRFSGLAPGGRFSVDQVVTAEPFGTEPRVVEVTHDVVVD